MAIISTVVFTGKSGREYEFNVYPLEENFRSIGAVYFVTHRKIIEDRGSHFRIYVGQTADLAERISNHHKVECFENHDANCLCVFVVDEEESRLVIERDLIDKYHPPCNE